MSSQVPVTSAEWGTFLRDQWTAYEWFTGDSEPDEERYDSFGALLLEAARRLDADRDEQAPEQLVTSRIQIVCLACELSRGRGCSLYPTSPARRGEPEHLRLRLLSVAGRLARHARRLRMPTHWPSPT